MEEITKTNRDIFLEHINSRLTSFGFDQKENKWEKIIHQQQPPTRINMNGVERIIPGTEKTINITIEIDGEGALIEKDIETPFTQIRFMTTEDGVTQDLCPIWCMYYDDQLLFDTILKNIFNI